MCSSLDGFLHLGGKLVFQITARLETIYIYRHIIEQVRSEAVERLDRFERNGGIERIFAVDFLHDASQIIHLATVDGCHVAIRYFAGFVEVDNTVHDAGIVGRCGIEHAPDASVWNAHTHHLAARTDEIVGDILQFVGCLHITHIAGIEEDVLHLHSALPDSFCQGWDVHGITLGIYTSEEAGDWMVWVTTKLDAAECTG